MKTKWQMVARGKAGWHATGLTETGYCTTSSGGTLEGWISEAVNGAFIYDAKDADYEAFASLFVAGPMYSPELRPYEYSAPFYGARGELAPANAFITLETLKALGVGGLSSVGVGIYEALLRRVAGVRFGRVIDGKAVFEDSHNGN